ncbi:MBL fold metallo-hydrolase [Nitrogeniibacter mangrovi]|uniref:MBL fold metallo-hydrolase n=1 Tax=Nitrogeniibacter mangrovi TaxID=2016596 RepID=A0A6C1B144_9RHOO|nr:MBL fold metallo-hydrolase [Nitrogeniibacter mangrovi]QID16548.1 MBL fold metallo-hydrolase [Nitrogeniibacter mangrovi]
MTAQPRLQYPFDTLPETGQWLTVAPGVHWVRMPLPFALDHINLWLLDDGGAVTLVDTGFGLPEVQAAWTHILETLGRPVARIVVTHCHPDHLGLAAWLSAQTGAEVHMTQGEFLGAQALWHQLPGFCVDDMVAQFRHHGLDDARLDALSRRGNAYRKGIPALPGHYERLVDGTTLSIGGHEWAVIVGTGHSPEHAALYCADLGILISGDMLLPTISTNISVFAATPHDDSLARFLDSIKRFKRLPDSTLVLPSHGRPFKGIHARVDQLHEHHRERCDALLAACTTPKCAGDLLETLFPRELDTHQVMFAMGEAIAHVNYLVRGRELRGVGDGSGVARYVSNALPE